MSDNLTAETRACVWLQDCDEGTTQWETDCENIHVIIDGTPLKNGMRFCCYCGKPLEESYV